MDKKLYHRGNGEQPDFQREAECGGLTPYDLLRLEQSKMSNDELCELCEKLISEMCQTGGRSFTMRVPVTIKDSDMLLSELVRRVKARQMSAGEVEELRGALRFFERDLEELRKENAELKKLLAEYGYLSRNNGRQMGENERLKGLIQQVFYSKYSDDELEYVDYEWEKFKTENNIQ